MNKSSKISISCSPKKPSKLNESMIKPKNKILCEEDSQIKNSNKKTSVKSVNNLSISNMNSLTNQSKSQRDDNYIDKSNSNVSIMSPSTREDELYNRVYNVFLGKFVEYQDKIKMNESESILECLIKSFDSLSVFNSKFKKISEMLNSFNDPNKTKILIDNHKEEYNKVLEENSKLKIKAFDSLLESKDNSINDLKKKYLHLKKKCDNYKEIINENSTLKSCYKEKSIELEKIKEKEVKLMKIIFFLNKKAGISLEEVINNLENLDNISSKQTGLNTEKEKDSTTSRLNTSEMTVYFPDKTTYNTNQTSSKKKVPKLNFTQLPGYESPLSSKNNEMIKINVNIEDKTGSNKK